MTDIATADPDDGVAGWIAAFVVLFAVIIGGYFSYRAGFFGVLVSGPGTTMGASLPDVPDTGTARQ